MLSRPALFLLTLAALASGSAGAPVGRWSCNEASGTTVFNSAPGANGALVGAVGFAPGGISGNCLDFTTYAGGYVTMGNAYAIDANAEFSFSIWVKTTSTSALFAISRHFTGIANGYMLGINSLGGTYSAPNRPLFYLNDIPGNTCDGTFNTNDGQWHHYVCTYRFIGTGSIRELWVDGVRQAANGFVGPNPHPTPSFMLGGVYSNSSGPIGLFQGQIDEVQVYDYAISADDIASIRATPTAVAGPKRCFCDLNNDGVRNTADLAVFLGRFGQPASIGSLGDINYDGVVNTGDLAIFLGRFGETCS